jgi:hypothetical protein
VRHTLSSPLLSSLWKPVPPALSSSGCPREDLAFR